MRMTNQPPPADVVSALSKLNVKYGVPLEILVDLHAIFSTDGNVDLADESILDEFKAQGQGVYWKARSDFYGAKTVYGDLLNNPFFNMFKKLDPLAAVESSAELIALALNKIRSCKNLEVDKLYSADVFDTAVQVGQIDSSANSSQSSTTPVPAGDNFDFSSYLKGLYDAINTVSSGNGFLFSAKTAPLPADISTCMGVGPTSDLDIPTFGLGKLDDVSVDGVKWLIAAAKKFTAAGFSLLDDIIKNTGNAAQLESKQDKVTEDLTKNKKNKTIENTMEVTKSSAVDIQREDFDKKVVDKTLAVEKFIAPQSDKAHCVVLLDCSASMNDSDIQGAPDLLSRSMYASVVLAALCQKVTERGDKFYIIPFSSTVGSVFEVTNNQTAISTLHHAVHVLPRGGTRFTTAFLRACELIKAVPSYRHCDIVVLTDAEDSSYSPSHLRGNLPPKTKVAGIHIGSTIDHKYKVKFDQLCDKGRSLKGEWDIKKMVPVLGAAFKGI